MALVAEKEPIVRSPAMVYDSERRTNVLFGATEANETWELNCGPSPEPGDLLVDLINFVYALNLHHGINNSLDAKLSRAVEALDDVNENNDISAINALEAFINSVLAQSDKHIPADSAQQLIAAAEQIIGLLGGA